MTSFAPVCPLPIADYPRVLMGHGGGGRLMHELIGKLFRSAFDNPLLEQAHDGAAFDAPGARLAFSTDSYVVRPLFFPGGDIGSLAIYGTANDLAMCGASARLLSAGFIIEEGLEMETLWRVAQSMASAARRAGVSIAAGDTKVVERGKGDQLFISTSGIGVVEAPRPVAPSAVACGDAIIVSGDLGRHGVAILAARADFALETAVESDCAPLWPAVRALLDAGVEVHCLRDLTRGGLAAALVEVAESARLDAVVHEASIPVVEPVRAVCELLGFDPLHLANEGRFAAWVPQRCVESALKALRTGCGADDATCIGRMGQAGRGIVRLRGVLGVERVLDMPSGELLPRIC